MTTTVWATATSRNESNGRIIVFRYIKDALKSTVEKNGFATLALVSTGENLREWTYYAGAEDEFMARLNEGLAGSPKAPINIHICEDSQWSMYDEFKRNVRE